MLICFPGYLKAQLMSTSKSFCFHKLSTISESESTIIAYVVQSSWVFTKDVDAVAFLASPVNTS